MMFGGNGENKPGVNIGTNLSSIQQGTSLVFLQNKRKFLINCRVIYFYKKMNIPYVHSR